VVEAVQAARESKAAAERTKPVHEQASINMKTPPA
jgi:hypothetical protein